MQRKRAASRSLFFGFAAQGVACVFLVFIYSGCSSSTTESTVSTDPTFPGVTVTVACPDETTHKIIDRFANSWAYQKQAKVQVTNYTADVGPEKSDADIWLIEPARVPHWAAADKLQSVPADLAVAKNYGWNDVLSIFSDRLLRWGDQKYAVPILGDAPVCFYRRDLFNDPKYADEFERLKGRKLKPPTTWEEFAEIAEYFNGKSGPSLPPLPAGNDALDREFQTIAASYVMKAVKSVELDKRDRDHGDIFSFHYNLTTGEPRIATPGFVAALKLHCRLQPCRPPGTAPHPPEAFANGKAVLCLADAHWIKRFQQNEKLDFGIIRVPGSSQVFDFDSGAPLKITGSNYVPYLGAVGWVGVVPRGAAHEEAAWSLLAELSSGKTSRDIVVEPEWGGGAVRLSQLKEQAGWSSFRLDPAATNALVTEVLHPTQVHISVSNPTTRLRLPNAAEHEQALVAELRAALAGQKTPEQALTTAAERWRVLDGNDKKQIKDDYARSLGLLPR
jgi:multiple sugar transport system substrate-binding protein